MSSDGDSSIGRGNLASFQSFMGCVADSFSSELQSNSDVTRTVEQEVRQSISSSMKNIKSVNLKPANVFLKMDQSEGFVQKDVSDITSNLDQTVKNISNFAVPKMVKEALQTYYQPIEENLGSTFESLRELSSSSFDPSNSGLDGLVEGKVNSALASLKNQYIQFEIQNFNVDANRSKQEITLDVKAVPATLKPFIKILIESYGFKRQLSKIEFKIVSEIVISGIRISNEEHLDIDLGNLEVTVSLFLKTMHLGPLKKEMGEKEIMSKTINRKLPNVEL